MITFDQVQLLEKKVSDAVQLIKKLKAEKKDLEDEKSLFQERIAELEILQSDLTSEQAQIEKGIIDALSQFDELDKEDEDTEEEENVSETSEVISTSEETEIAQSAETESEDSVSITEEAPVVEISAADNEEDNSDETGYSDISGNHSEQLEMSTEDSQESNEETLDIQDSEDNEESLSSSSDETVIEEIPEQKNEKDSGYPQNLEIF